MTRYVYSHLSILEDVVFNYFFKDAFIPEGHGQFTSGSASLPDPVALETEEETLEREQNRRVMFLKHWVTEYKCAAGMFVDNVPAVKEKIVGYTSTGVFNCCKRVNTVEI